MPKSLVVTIVDSTGAQKLMHTYGFISAKFDEGIQKRANICEARGHSDVLRIGSDEDFDVTLEGLDDRKDQFLKVWVQEIRLLLEVLYLCKGILAIRAKPILSACDQLTVNSMECNRSDSDLDSSSDGSWFRSSERRRWRFSRNHSRFSNLVGIARFVVLVSSSASITDGG